MKPQITLGPAPEVNWGDRVEITCTVMSEHLGGTFILRKTQDSFRLEKFSENEAATFIFLAVDFSQKGSYFCEYQKKIDNQVINYPQGNTADLTVKGNTVHLCVSDNSHDYLQFEKHVSLIQQLNWRRPGFPCPPLMQW